MEVGWRGNLPLKSVDIIYMGKGYKLGIVSFVNLFLIDQVGKGLKLGLGMFIHYTFLPRGA